MIRTTWIAIAVFALLIVGGIYASLGGKLIQKDSRMTVVASFYPLAHFAEQIGGGFIKVVNITPAGTEPHDFEPTPRDLATAQRAKLFLFNGGGLDPWAEKIQADLADKGIRTIKMSDSIEVMSEGSEVDPHFWLSPVIAQDEVQLITSVLAELDPTNAGTYQQNAATYLSKLRQLDAEFKTGLSQCKKDTIVTSHGAFGYLARQYGFKVRSIAGLSPDAEPSTQELADLTSLVRETGIRYIFTETLLSPKLAETIAKEVGAETLVFNPIEGLTKDELESSQNYLTIMRDNLLNLRTALQCQ